MGIPQLADLVLENANAPGTGAFILGGAPDGRQTFADAFPAGGEVFYYASDGSQTEWGIGTLAVGSPNTLARTKVIGNLFGSENALNFTSSVTIWCEVPAKRSPSLDDAGLLPVSGSPDFTQDVALSAKVAEGRYISLVSKGKQSLLGPLDLSKDAADAASAGDSPQVILSVGGVPRWGLGQDGKSAAGNAASSNLSIYRYDDTGKYVDTPFSINRDTGEVLIAKKITVPDIDTFDGGDALNAKTAEKRYAKLNVDVPVGCPQLWPLNTPPNGWLALNGAAFDKTQYPGLAAVFTSGVLPDMRGKFIRGWDNGAKIDPNDGQSNAGTSRALLSVQSDALQNITGAFGNSYRGTVGWYNGAFFDNGNGRHPDWGDTGSVMNLDGVAFDASRVARTSGETRPVNMAWNMIVRAV